MIDSLENFKSFVAKKLIGKTLKFYCDCIVPIDIIGTVKDFEIIGNEILYIIDVNGKIIKIGENHPNLQVKEL